MYRENELYVLFILAGNSLFGAKFALLFDYLRYVGISCFQRFFFFQMNEEFFYKRKNTLQISPASTGTLAT